MSMTIGRCAIDEDPYGGTIRVSGDVLSFESDLGAASLDECIAKMQQLAGLIDNDDEEVFPFTWTEDATFDGFYRVRSVQLSPVAVYLETGFCPFAIEMVKVGGFARPAFESISQLLLRPNSHGVTTPSGYLTSWWTGASSDYESDRTGSTLPYTPEGGAAKVFAAAAPLSTPQSTIWSVAAENYYLTACRLEVSYDSGTTWHDLVGTQIPSTVGIWWRISNGFVRFGPDPAIGSVLRVETFMSGAWSSNMGTGTALTIDVGYSPGLGSFFSDSALGTPLQPNPVRVIRNAPECVVVRTTQVARDAAFKIDWTIRRGTLWGEMSLIAPATATARQWGLSYGTGPVTTFTGGVRQTTADAAGRRWLLTSGSAVSTHVGIPGKLYLSSAALTMQMAFTPHSVPATYSDTAFRDLYFAARTERVRVVPR